MKSPVCLFIMKAATFIIGLPLWAYACWHIIKPIRHGVRALFAWAGGT